MARKKKEEPKTLKEKLQATIEQGIKEKEKRDKERIKYFDDLQKEMINRRSK